MQSFNHSECEYILTPDEDSSLLEHDAVSIGTYQSSDSLRATLDYSEYGTSKLLRNVVHTWHTYIHTYGIHTFISTYERHSIARKT